MQEQSSYVHGAHDVPLIGETIGPYLASVAARHGDSDAVVVPHQNVRWSYREFDQRVTRVAAGLLKLGLRPGDRVGIWSQNCAEWVLVQFATARAGLIMVNINPAYRRSELEYVLDKVQCSALILAPSFKSSDYIAIVRDVVPAIHHARPGALHAQRLPHLRHVVRLGDATTPGMFNFDAVVAAPGPDDLAHLAAVEAGLQFDDPVNIQFTSGTTGSPKGATLTHHNILNNGFFIGEAMKLGADDRLCIPVPLYHCFGMVLGNLACVTHGAAMVFPGESFEPKAVLETVQAERCTALHGVPTMSIAMLDHPAFASFDLASLRTGIAAGAPCPPAMMRRMIDQMHLADITIGYGMTETSPLSTQTRPGASMETRTDTVGQMLPHFEGRVIDGDGALMPLGQPGEYCSRGPGVMLGYWNQPDATAGAIRDGWMHSGDLATIDDEGRVRIVGRIKDMIIRGGENIYPAEIEAFLLGHPDVADVAVFGIPDERLGEQVCAWVRARGPVEPAAITEWCRVKIAHHKVPALVRIVDELPMTITGKVQKFVMRDAESHAR